MQVLVLVVVVHKLVLEMEEVVHKLVSEMEEVVRKLVLETGVAQGAGAPAHCACTNLEIQ